MVTAQVEKVMLAVQKSHGPRCPECRSVCEIHNFSTGGFRFIAGKGAKDDIHDDLRCWCTNCKKYIENPIIEKKNHSTMSSTSHFRNSR